MPLYMDIHRGMKGITKEALQDAHQKDLKIQGKYGVNFIDYWYNADEGTVFCLSDAPSKKAANAVHLEAHGAEADEIIEVKRGSV